MVEESGGGKRDKQETTTTSDRKVCMAERTVLLADYDAIFCFTQCLNQAKLPTACANV